MKLCVADLELQPAFPVDGLGRILGTGRVRTVAAGNAIMVLTGAALLGLFYFRSLYEQVILHYRAITAGLSQLPLALALIATAAPPPRSSPGTVPRRSSAPGRSCSPAGSSASAGTGNGLSHHGQDHW